MSHGEVQVTMAEPERGDKAVNSGVVLNQALQHPVNEHRNITPPKSFTEHKL